MLKKLLFIALILLVLGSLVGCGARRRAAMATATAQALTATAMAQSPVATAPAVSAPGTTGVILFQDDFQDGQPDGWQITAAWYVQQEGNVYYFGSSGQGGAWVLGGGGWSDYEFQTMVRVTAGGVILSYRLSQEGRYLLHLREDGLYLTKEYPKGNYTALTQTAAPSLNTWHQVSVAGYGGHLQVYVDRALQLDYTDPSPLLQGTIAVATLEGYQAAVDDMLVTRLTAALPTPAPMALPVTVAPPPAPLPVEAGLPLEEAPPLEEGAPPPLPVAGLPVIDYFRSEPSEREGCYYLHWELHDASVAYLNDVGVVAPGSEEVCPEESGIYVYTLRAENDAGSVEETVAFETGGAAGQPDLEFDSVQVWPDPLAPQTVFVDISVRNNGDGPAGAFTVRWYPHQRSDVVGCSIDVDGLSGHSSEDLESCFYTYTGRGEMHWRAVADADADISESNEDNNEQRGMIRIEAGGGVAEDNEPPELTLTRSLANPTTNDQITFTANASDPSGIDHIEILVNQELAQSCPDSPCVYQGGPYPAGPVYYGASAYDTQGNHAWTGYRTLNVEEAQPAGQPDLVIRNLSIEPNPVLLGGIGVFTVRFDVVNEGNAQAAPSTAHWEIMADNRWSFDCPVTALAPGTSAPCENVFVGLPSQPANYGTRAIADHGGAVTESNEGNNVTKETLQVQQ